MKRCIPLLSALFLLPLSESKAQCSSGEVEVSIQVSTDAYGYEAYWQLVPAGNSCGNGTIFFGGNNNVGCNGAGDQTATPGNGYGNNQNITEGPWCLTDGASYSILFIDDWADGGTSFTVFVDGSAIGQYVGTGAGNTFTFVAQAPLALNAAVEAVTSFGGTSNTNMTISAKVKNLGSTTITALEMSYVVDGGAPVVAMVNGLNIAAFGEAQVDHPNTWNTGAAGYADVSVEVTAVNGNPDMDPADNSATNELAVWDPAPNIIDSYIGIAPVITDIVTAANQVSIPRDLDWFPDLNKRELWVLDKGTEASGSSTITVSNAGESNQTSVKRTDGNAYHFMSLSTGIAFSEGWNFATSPGVFDANHNGGAPFTGPALWNSDPAVYAQPSGGNGSHIDMLHASPYSQGIAHEVDNVFWVVDGYSNDIVRYDFKDDHGPGNDDHNDAVVHRYAGLNMVKDPNNHIVSHCQLDKATGWLYAVDHGNDRVIRLDINTGTLGGTPTFGPFEPIAEYRYVTGFTWEAVVTTGLVEPAGIVVMDDRMLISDHANGDIIIYDISVIPAVEMGRINTGDPGIMGLSIAPDGRIWYVNATTNKVRKVDGASVGIREATAGNGLRAYPNPATDAITVQFNDGSVINGQLRIFDAAGREVYQNRIANSVQRIPMGDLSNGVYEVSVITLEGIRQRTRVVVQH